MTAIKNNRSRIIPPGIGAAHLAVILFGFAGLFGKFIHQGPEILVFGRTLLGAVALAPLLWVGRWGRLPRCQPVNFLQGGLLAVHWYAFFLSIQVSTVAIGLLTYSTFPLFVTFLEPFFFREPLRLKHCGIAVLVFVGLVMVIPTYDFSQAPARGAAWGVLSGLTFAFLGMVNRSSVRTTPPLVLTFYQNGFAAVFMAPLVVMTRQGMPPAGDLALLGVLGVACTALAHYLFISSLIHIRARTAGVIAALEPVYGVAMAVVLLGEVPGGRTLCGGGIIIGAAVVSALFQE